MHSKDLGYFTVVKDGKEIRCDVVCTFEHEGTQKHYIVYTDGTMTDEGQTEVYASVILPGEDPLKLLPIETEEEWDIVASVLDELNEQDWE